MYSLSSTTSMKRGGRRPRLATSQAHGFTRRRDDESSPNMRLQSRGPSRVRSVPCHMTRMHALTWEPGEYRGSAEDACATCDVEVALFGVFFLSNVGGFSTQNRPNNQCFLILLYDLEASRGKGYTFGGSNVFFFFFSGRLSSSSVRVSVFFF